ncbi:MAG: hypothetical protein H6622_12550 [Halobacteriovoraceae bacterium]|nr:hypothetical protein [Halobacteriovoraceae bacterium]
MNHKREKIIALIFGLLAIGFGAMTIKSGGFALFGGIEGKEFAGKYVPFVLWFNFIAGFFYVISGIGITLRTKWALKISFALAILTSLVFIAFGVHTFLGNPYEMRTVGAMTVRTVFWVMISVFLVKISHKRNSGIPL